ncbi:hypothetical protein ACIF9R_35765 [Streptomyces sp. NPDC086080]|uniref:hypothetical protein n=1 Tax=Streptomyces sp. NPDC086080 TaxID=3365748 RepID=UPI0037D09482
MGAVAGGAAAPDSPVVRLVPAQRNQPAAGRRAAVLVFPRIDADADPAEENTVRTLAADDFLSGGTERSGSDRLGGEPVRRFPPSSPAVPARPTHRRGCRSLTLEDSAPRIRFPRTVNR